MLKPFVANYAVGAVAVADMKTYQTVQPSEPVVRRAQFCKPVILLVRRRLGVLLTRAIATRAEVAVAEATSGGAESGARAAVALMDKFNELFKEQQTIAA